MEENTNKPVISKQRDSITIEQTLNGYKAEATDLTAKLKTFTAINNDEDFNTAQSLVKTTKDFLNRLEIDRKIYTSKLDEHKKKVMSLEKSINGGVCEYFYKIKKLGEEWVMRVEAERTAKIKFAEEQAAKLKEQANQVTTRRTKLQESLFQAVTPEGRAKGMDKTALAFLKSSTLNPEYYGGVEWINQIKEQWMPVIENVVDEKASALITMAREQAIMDETEAHINSVILTQSIINEAPKRATNSYIKTTIQANELGFVNLLTSYLAMGNDRSKLDFLLRFAEKENLCPNGCTKVEVPVFVAK